MKRKPAQKEGQVYRCTWQKTRGRFKLKCIRPVGVSVESEDLEDARDKLISEILTLTGDGEPCLQFVPDLPEPWEGLGYFDPPYHHIGYNEFVEWLAPAGDITRLYTGGLCKHCHLGVGPRTVYRRTISKTPRYDVSGFYKDKQLGAMFSEDILNHLLPHLEGKATPVPVEILPRISRRVRKRYFELSFEPELDAVVPRESDSRSGWRCHHCGTVMVHWFSPQIGSVMFGVNRAHAKGPVLLARNGLGRYIAVSKAVSDALVRDKKIRGLVLGRVAMFHEDQVLTAREVKRLKLSEIEP